MDKMSYDNAGNAQVRFLSAPPHSTLAIELESGNNSTSTLMDALAKAGWFRTLKGTTLKPSHDRVVMSHVGNGTVGKGSGHKSDPYLTEARKILVQHGYSHVRHVRLPEAAPCRTRSI